MDERIKDARSTIDQVIDPIKTFWFKVKFWCSGSNYAKKNDKSYEYSIAQDNPYIRSADSKICNPYISVHPFRHLKESVIRTYPPIRSADSVNL